MKKFMFLLLVSAMLLILAACGEASEQQEIPQNIETPAVEPEEEPIEEPEEEPIEEPEEEIIEDPFALWDFSALALVGYYFDEDDSLFIDTEGWVEIYSLDEIKEYFYGTWERAGGISKLTVDDTKENNHFWWMCDGFFKVGDNVIVSAHWDMAGPNYYYWLDMNEPDILFYQTNRTSPHLVADYKTAYFTKTDAPLNQPEDGFLTWFRERELAAAYGINPEMLTGVEFLHEESGRVLNRNARWRHFEMYLISESPEKLIFNAPLDDCVGMSPTYIADAIVTLDKINGEWVRTIEVNEVAEV
jgi:hypothetical protein